MMQQYEMAEYTSGDKVAQRWLVADDGNTIRKVQLLNEPYSKDHGDVVTYFDPSYHEKHKEQLAKIAKDYKVQQAIDKEFEARNRWLLKQEVRCDD